MVTHLLGNTQLSTNTTHVLRTCVEGFFKTVFNVSLYENFINFINQQNVLSPLGLQL